MSDALAYAMLLIQQHQADSLRRQQKLQQLFSSFLAGELTAEQYERNLEAASAARVSARSPQGA